MSLFMIVCECGVGDIDRHVIPLGLFPWYRYWFVNQFVLKGNKKTSTSDFLLQFDTHMSHTVKRITDVKHVVTEKVAELESIKSKLKEFETTLSEVRIKFLLLVESKQNVNLSPKNYHILY